MRRLLVLASLLLVLGWLLTGLTQVRQGERVVVRRFGRVRAGNICRLPGLADDLAEMVF